MSSGLWSLIQENNAIYLYKLLIFDLMDTEPIIEFKGRNGRVELYRDFVRFDRGTVMGFISQGLKGKKDIYFKNITSIQIPQLF